MTHRNRCRATDPIDWEKTKKGRRIFACCMFCNTRIRIRLGRNEHRCYNLKEHFRVFKKKFKEPKYY